MHHKSNKSEPVLNRDPLWISNLTESKSELRGGCFVPFRKGLVNAFVLQLVKSRESEKSAVAQCWDRARVWGQTRCGQLAAASQKTTVESVERNVRKKIYQKKMVFFKFSILIFSNVSKTFWIKISWKSKLIFNSIAIFSPVWTKETLLGHFPFKIQILII